MSDLNIIQRGINKSEWTAEGGKITKDDLHKVREQRTDNSSALNALPTPFARFFVADEAFRRLYEQRNSMNPNDKMQAGKAYERLVSDCLDIFEMLFNKSYHDSCGEKIVVREWSVDENMRRLKITTPILHEAISNYIKDDLGDVNKLYFVILQSKGWEYLLGTSSSLTGFVTPPDLDKKQENGVMMFMGDRYAKMPQLKRKGANMGRYFLDERLFEERSAEFKNYMYQILFSGSVDERFAHLRDYIKSFSNDTDIRTDYVPEVIPFLSEDNDEVEINGLKLFSSKEIGSYFTDVIVKLPFKVARDNFKLPMLNGDYDYDYMLPLSDEAIERLDYDNTEISFKQRTNSVLVTINVNGKKEEKEYLKNQNSVYGNKGRILDLDEYKVKFDMALFPNILSTDEKENSYFKLMLVGRDSNEYPTLTVSDITCQFYKKGTLISEAVDENYQNGVRRVVQRSIQKDESLCGSEFYELFNTAFDLIKVSIKLGSETYSGVVIPKWTIATNNRKSYKYAVDFGTTNTYISRREDSKDILEPEQLKMDKPIMSYFHEKDSIKQKKEIDLWEDAIPSGLADLFLTEFIPPFIDGDRYKFPIRTAMTRTTNPINDVSLFDNCNIAFSYGKKPIIGQNEPVTDLKWDEEEIRNGARLFIEELLMLIKYDMLQENVDIKNTQLIWFRPLSMKGNIQYQLADIWKDLSQKILGISEGQLKCYTESEAPYYYYSAKNVIKAIKSVAVVDIGGGSTDIVCFEDNKPKFANSVHFGCDVLWGNGHNKIKNAKENGIFCNLKDSIRFKEGQSELSEVNKDMSAEKSVYSTKDIINFWPDNDDVTGVAGKLRNQYAYLFLYHYAAIIYYLAKMLKSKHLECPQAILFSGNGSKYIDNFLVSDVALLTKLTMIILKKEFPNAENVQLILKDKRKESTCYGGLCRPDSAVEAERYVFMGVDDKQYRDAGELETDFNNGLSDRLKHQIDSLNQYYIDMLQELVRDRRLNELLPIDEIRKCINTGIMNSIRTNFTNEVVQKYGKSVPVDDSLFFMPVIDVIFNLTKLK